MQATGMHLSRPGFHAKVKNNLKLFNCSFDIKRTFFPMKDGANGTCKPLRCHIAKSKSHGVEHEKKKKKT